VQATNVVECAPAGRFDVATLRNLVQVLGPDDARRAIANIGETLAPGGLLLMIGHVVDDRGTAPPEAVGMNLAFLSIYDEGQARSEHEHRAWLAVAGFSDIEVHYRAAQGGASIVAARKRS
jgi:hypothetical protein